MKPIAKDLAREGADVEDTGEQFGTKDVSKMATEGDHEGGSVADLPQSQVLSSLYLTESTRPLGGSIKQPSFTMVMGTEHSEGTELIENAFAS